MTSCASGLAARAQDREPDAAPAASPAPAPKVIIPPPEPRTQAEPPEPLAPPGEPAAAGDAGAASKQKKKKGDAGARSEDDADLSSSNSLAAGARLIMGFERRSERPAGGQTEPGGKAYGFTIRQIRLQLKGSLAERFRVNVSFDLSDALEPEAGAAYDQPPYLRTATLEYRHSRELRLQVGRFKRPFSRLELESASDLPILRRGLFNGLALEDNQWGDRAIGVMASGRLKAPRLRWYLSLTNPDWSPTLLAEGVDVIGRVEWRLLDGVILGANVAYKNIELGNDRLNDVAYGGDVALGFGEANVLVEASSVALPFEVDRPRGLGALVMLDYTIPLNHDWSLQPVVFAEYADADTDVLQNESVRLVFGLNALGYSGFRVMPEVELVRSIGDTSAQNPWLESERVSLIFSLVP